VLLRPIKEAGALLPKLIGVDGMIIGLLLIGSGARVVWPLLKVAKKKRYKHPIRANLL
jgi:hypothetical protein